MTDDPRYVLIRILRPTDEYEQGEVVSVPRAKAERWIAEGIAQAVAEDDGDEDDRQ